MKTIYCTAILALVSGCAHHAAVSNPETLKPVQTETRPADVSTSDATEDKETQRYQASVQKIRSAFGEEQRVLEDCYAAKRGNTCLILKQNFCEVNVYMDSRGGEHKKQYCK